MKFRTIDGEAVLLHRHRKGWTLTQLAEASGVSRVTVRRIESGEERAHLVTVRALEAALGATLAPQGGNHDQASDNGNGNDTGGDSGGGGSAG